MSTSTAAASFVFPAVSVLSLLLPSCGPRSDGIEGENIVQISPLLSSAAYCAVSASGEVWCNMRGGYPSDDHKIGGFGPIQGRVAEMISAGAADEFLFRSIDGELYSTWFGSFESPDGEPLLLEHLASGVKRLTRLDRAHFFEPQCYYDLGEAVHCRYGGYEITDGFGEFLGVTNPPDYKVKRAWVDVAWASGSTKFRPPCALWPDGHVSCRFQRFERNAGQEMVPAGFRETGPPFADVVDLAGQFAATPTGEVSYRISDAITESVSHGIGVGAGAIAAESSLFCFVRRGGTIWCSGANYGGQFGIGSTEPASAPIEDPIQVIGIDNATKVFDTFNTMCALRGNGGVSCWGSIHGSGTPEEPNAFAATPVAVSGVYDVKEIVFGARDANTRNEPSFCYLTNSGEIRCTGVYLDLN